MCVALGILYTVALSIPPEIFPLRSASDRDILSQMADERKKHPAAVALGRLGGKKRAANLSAEKLREQARIAAAARWAKLKPTVESTEREPSDSPKPQPAAELEAPFEGRDSNAILALREQGYEVGEPARHPDGRPRSGWAWWERNWRRDRAPL